MVPSYHLPNELVDASSSDEKESGIKMRKRVESYKFRIRTHQKTKQHKELLPEQTTAQYIEPDEIFVTE